MSNWGTARTVNNYKMPFSVMELLVTGELCVLLENESTKWIPALQVWCEWKAMLLIWVSLFPNTFWKHKYMLQLFANIYVWVKTTMLVSCLFFMLCCLAEYWEKNHRKLKKHSATFETTSWIFQTGIFPWNFGSSPRIKIRQSMLDSASHDERFLPTCRCSVKRISRNSLCALNKVVTLL